MTQINNDSVSQCLLHCLKQTELKYGEKLVHSSGLSKHGTFLMWKITNMRKICPFRFSQKFCITFFVNSLLQHVTVGPLVYSEADFVMLWCVWLSVLDLSSLSPKSKKILNSCLNPKWLDLIVTNRHSSTVFLVWNRILYILKQDHPNSVFIYLSRSR